ncbi:MAG: hypothetical protein WC114_10155 [Smithellaceae bacterium]
MPITREMLSQYVQPTFVESGTYQCEAVDLARELGFQTIHTIDIEPKHVDAAKAKGYNAYCGDSPAVLAKILPGIEGQITFWLDAHPFVKPMDIFHTHFPLMRELRSIKKYADPEKHVLLMDDMRIVPDLEKELLLDWLDMLWPDGVVRWHGDRYCDDDILCCDLRGER